MTKRIFFLSAALALTMGAYATSLTPSEALARLTGTGHQKLSASSLSAPQLRLTASAANGEAALYVFDNSDNNGYLVVSADDATLPLLGYTDSGSFDPDNIPPALEYWLNSYTKQISYLKSASLSADKGVEVQLPDWDPIEPLVTTKWNQDAPFYNDCPTYQGQRCYTGCVATSMAQVLNYYKYPEIGIGSITYTTAETKQKLTMNFAKQPFDWDNMLDTYVSGKYNDEEAAAVAYLMKACGYSVQMSYTPNMSGAMSSRIADALVKYFDYDNHMAYLHRAQFSYNEWAEMVYNNLKNIGPVIYDGTAPLDGGHSFVCDGYDGNGYFHFNWGWGGMSDGYFMLDVLNPSSLGIGGGSVGGFNFDQDALFGIQPSNADAKLIAPVAATQFGNLQGYSVNNTLHLQFIDDTTLGIGYMGSGEVSLSFGMIFENLEDATAPLQSMAIPGYGNISFTNGRYLDCSTGSISVPLKGLSFEKGVRYKATLASMDMDDPDAEWVPVRVNRSFTNYVIISKEGLSFNVENIPISRFTISDLEFTTTLYNGCPANIKGTVTNNTDKQLTGGITLMLFNAEDELQFQSDSFLLTLNPGESLSKEWIASFHRMQNVSEVTSTTELYMKVLNLEDNTYYDMEPVVVNMEKNPGAPTIISRILIENATEGADKVYEVINPENMEIKLTLRVGKGYFAYPITVCVLEVDESGRYLIPLINNTFEEVPFLNKGDNTELYCDINFASAELGKIYFLQSRYSTDTTYEWMSNQTQFIVKESGIEKINTELEGINFIYDKGARSIIVVSDSNIASVDAYLPNGSQVALSAEKRGNQALINLENQPSGVMIINATDTKGNRKTLKVAL